MSIHHVSSMTRWVLSPTRSMQRHADAVSAYRARRRSGRGQTRPSRVRSTYRRLDA